MSDILGIVNDINKECKYLFTSNFKLKLTNKFPNSSLYEIEGTSKALNRYDSKHVKVLKWFKRFWLYIEIRFVIENAKKGNKRIENIHTSISLSVYEGDDSDDFKIQLFRAEWDDMNNSREIHSQPHWHITSSQAIERTFEEYSNNFDDGEFISFLEKEKSKIFDVKRVHFAMNGNWQNDQTHIHNIQNARQVSKWLKGLLAHIMIELDD